MGYDATREEYWNILDDYPGKLSWTLPKGLGDRAGPILTDPEENTISLDMKDLGREQVFWSDFADQCVKISIF